MRWLIFCLAFALAAGLWAADVVEFKPFKVWREVPEAELPAPHSPAAERFQLDSGLIVFLLEDHELPLLDLQLLARAGEVFEPAEQVGVAQAMAAVMRSGGSAKYPADKLDQLLEGLAATINFGIGEDSAFGSLSVLPENFAPGLDIFVDLLRNPVFPEEKIDLYLEGALNSVAKRNDQPGAIAWREFRKALYGEKSPYARVPEYATLNKIDRPALRQFHQAYFQPNQFILGVAGDFKIQEMRDKLQASFSSWPAAKIKPPGVPDVSTSKKQKTLYCERPRLNQASLLLGHVLDLRRGHKDAPALELANEVFSARLGSEICAKESPACSASAHTALCYCRPGIFYCAVQARNEQVLAAAESVKRELARLRDRGVAENELAEARARSRNAFVHSCSTPLKILKRQMTCEFYGLPMDFDSQRLQALQQVTAEDVKNAAKKYLDQDKLVLLVVGDTSGQEPDRSCAEVKNVQLLDVAIPLPQTEPMVLDPERELRGKRLLADALKAAGGLKVFENTRSLRAGLILTVKALGHEFHLKASMLVKLPDRVRMDVAGPFGPISQVINPEGAWRVRGSSSQEISPEDTRKNLRTLLQTDLGILCFLAGAREGYNVQALEPIRDGERDLLGAEIEGQSLGRIKLWFDAQTRLLVKMRYVADGARHEYDKYFKDHAAFGEMTLARRIEDKDPDGTQAIDMLSLEINPQCEDSAFKKPEKAVMPPQ